MFFGFWVSESFSQDTYCLSKPFSRLQRGKLFFFFLNIFIMKNLTNFHETVETDVDPRLLFTIFFSHYTVNNNRVCLSAHSYSFWPQ